MQREKFLRIYDNLPIKRKKVLLGILRGDVREKILLDAQITDNSLAQHRRMLYRDFEITTIQGEIGNEKVGENKLPLMVAMFAKYMPEIVSDNYNLSQNSYIDKLLHQASEFEFNNQIVMAIDTWYRIIITNGSDKKYVQEIIRLEKICNFTKEQVSSNYQENDDYRKLETFLIQKNWRKADELTTELVLKIARQEQDGWLTYDGIYKIPCSEICIINSIWQKNSGGIYGFSAQRKIWNLLSAKGEQEYELWQKFGDLVGWRSGSDYDGWRYYEEINWSNPELILGHLPLVPAGSLIWNYGFSALGSLWCCFTDRLEVCGL